MNVDDILAAYRRTNQRILFLDYDGTLVGFKKDPSKARPTRRLLSCLAALTRDPCNTVVVISGRDHQTLEKWLGELPLGFAAEHGFLYKTPGSSWQQTVESGPDWKPSVRKVMRQYARKALGAWVEEKANAFAWHCRAVNDADEAMRLQNELAAELAPLATRFKLRVLNGRRVVDVYPLAYSKGTAAARWLKVAKHDFILAAGDDVTDEEMFKAMPRGSFTVKVGPGQTLAIQKLTSHDTMLRLLEKLAKANS